MEISTDTAHGHDSMTAFIRRHMSSILQPFADHVDDLHKAVSQVKANVADIDSRTSTNTEQLRQHQELFKDMQSYQRKIANDVSTLESELKKTNREKAELEADHRETQARVNAHNDRHNEADKKMQAMENRVNDVVHQQEQFMQDRAVMDDKILNKLEPTLERLSGSLASLDHAHGETAQLLQATKIYSERRGNDLDAFIKAYELQHSRDQKSFVEVSRHVSELGAHLKVTNQKMQTNADHHKTINKILGPLKAQVEQMEDAQKSLQTQQDDNSRHVTDIWMRFQSLCSTTDDLTKRQWKNEETVKRLMRLQDVVTNMHELVTKNANTIKELSKVSDSHVEFISKADTRATSIENNTDDLRAQTARLMVKFTNFEAGWAESQPAQRQRASNEFGSQARRFQDIESRLQKSSGDIGNVVARLRSLEKESAAANEQVAKLSIGMDLTQEYWKGLSNGFRETHKSVVVDNEMLPPKGMHSIPLPSVKGAAPCSSPGPATVR